MAASVVADGQSSGTTNQSAIVKADLEPWRFRGYPKFCRWVASDDDFFVMRIFGSTSARLAMYLQDQIVEQEKALKDADERAMQDGLDSGTFRNDQQSERVEKMSKLLPMIERYHKFLLGLMDLKSRSKATPFQVGNVRQWLQNANDPILDEEVAYLNEEDDLVPVASTPKAPLRQLIDRFSALNFLRLPPCIRERKRNERLYNADEDFEMQTTVYNKDRLFEKIMTVFTIIVGLAMLIGPLWILQHLSTEPSNLQVRLGVITGFIALFTILTSLFTVAKAFEVLAATAAYGAVLMVFMQFGTYPSASNGG